MSLRRAPTEYYLRRVEFATKEVLRLAGYPFFGWENRVSETTIHVIADHSDVAVSYIEESLARHRGDYHV